MTPLPTCKWRGKPSLRGRYPCSSPLLRVAAGGVSADYCRTCLAADRDLSSALASRRKKSLPSRPPCAHLGSPTGETRPCKGCNRTLAVAVHNCARHGACAVSKLLAGLSCCRICPDYSPVEKGA